MWNSVLTKPLNTVNDDKNNVKVKVPIKVILYLLVFLLLSLCNFQELEPWKAFFKVHGWRVGGSGIIKDSNPYIVGLHFAIFLW